MEKTEQTQLPMDGKPKLELKECVGIVEAILFVTGDAVEKKEICRALEITEKCSHTRPDGSRWNTVSPAAKGENIARGQKTADKVMAAWMSSDGHMRNILRESFGSIGVACVKKGNIYHWVQIFGR